MIEYNLTGKLRSFEQAFSGNISGCSMECDCGKTYYDNYNSYDWYEGELEALEESPNAFAVGHSVGVLYLNGKEFVAVCDCWHDVAIKFCEKMDANAFEIAQYLSTEKRRFSEEAAAMPTVSEGWLNMDSAPKDGRNIRVRDKEGKIHNAHFAQDLSGEEQPPFSGWFYRNERNNQYHQVKPVEWRSLDVID